MADKPIQEILEEVDPLVQAGATIHQKFTCDHCGARQTMTEPNKLYTSGLCEECGGTTNIEEKGCGYILILG
jgi:transcription elongation factor Elf1